MILRRLGDYLGVLFSFYFLFLGLNWLKNVKICDDLFVSFFPYLCLSF